MLLQATVSVLTGSGPGRNVPTSEWWSNRRTKTSGDFRVGFCLSCVQSLSGALLSGSHVENELGWGGSNCARKQRKHAVFLAWSRLVVAVRQLMPLSHRLTIAILSSVRSGVLAGLSAMERSMETACGCCPQASWPALKTPADFSPSGTEVQVGRLRVYQAGAAGPTAVVVIQEIYGWEGRLKGICDTLAAEGHMVVMPDLHHGETAHHKSDAEKLTWLAKFPEGRVCEDLQAVITWLQSKGVNRIGSVGFCWGAWAICKASACGLALQCGVAAHPSTKIERTVFGADEVALAGAVRMPMLLLPAGSDPAELKPQGLVAQALQQGASVEFPDMVHGWVTRGDLQDPAVKRDVERALGLILNHLRSYL
ncbi:unnamed protein product [Effrenium voratum]|nr:unnamed protein product [Effrenium voratum]